MSPQFLCQDVVRHTVFPRMPRQPGNRDGVPMAGWSPLAVHRCLRALVPSRIWASSAETPCAGCGWHGLAQGKVGGPEWGSGFSSAGGEDDGSCEVNGRLYRDGETFQPHCRIRCQCEDGGFTCVPLCSEDIRLPSWDCPNPRRVEVPGKCCPEWVCDQGRELGVQRLPAQGEHWASPSLGQGHLGAGAGLLRSRDTWTCQSPGFPDRSWEGLVVEETRKTEWGVTRPLKTDKTASI